VKGAIGQTAETDWFELKTKQNAPQSKDRYYSVLLLNAYRLVTSNVRDSTEPFPITVECTSAIQTFQINNTLCTRIVNSVLFI